MPRLARSHCALSQSVNSERASDSFSLPRSTLARQRGVAADPAVGWLALLLAATALRKSRM